ncbi:GNAT family N-acetyltransferase [Natrarchaeobius chitinivorans]|uniref:GNAT family N-acetyltransferase n=1 Tax=Natrarchaeobius chitinivorans TaxID=1679083 RepID=UPI001FB32135|nr:hypothetical protein [Natrarchaeobius chitinivorans]
MFPETIETDSLVLERLSPEYVDALELYELFARSRDDVSAVFEYVPQDPYSSVKDAHNQLAEAEASWDDGETAQYAVRTVDGDLA